jgi:hypothetical protein
MTSINLDLLASNSIHITFNDYIIFFGYDNNNIIFHINDKVSTKIYQFETSIKTLCDDYSSDTRILNIILQTIAKASTSFGNNMLLAQGDELSNESIKLINNNCDLPNESIVLYLCHDSTMYIFTVNIVQIITTSEDDNQNDTDDVSDTDVYDLIDVMQHSASNTLDNLDAIKKALTELGVI